MAASVTLVLDPIVSSATSQAVSSATSGAAATARRTLDVPADATILSAAHAAGLELLATCGGRGRCTSCRVRFLEGAPPPPTIADVVQLGPALVDLGYRLACQCRPSESATVAAAPTIEEHGLQILAGAAALPAALRLDSGVTTACLDVPAPAGEHAATSDLESLLAVLGCEPADVAPAALAALPAALREAAGTVTVTRFGRRVLAVDGGDTRWGRYGLAVDIGTTSVVTALLDLGSGEVMGTLASPNPQAVWGADLMSRIAFVQADAANLRRLRTKIVALLNRHVAALCRETGVLARAIAKVTVVGNTCMHHLLLGIDPTWVGLAPYAPVLRHALELPARELHLRVAPEAPVCLLPLIAGFVGADAVAVALATGITERAELRLAVDIGTNGEVLLGSRDGLWTCSAPAGPALEGAQVRHGMRAALGAIDRVTVGDDVGVHVIGDGPALGICGSGIVDLVAGLLDAGAIDATGLIDLDRRGALAPPLASRLERRGEERLVVVCRPGEAGAPRELALTQEDVRQVQLAKGAIASGIALLVHAMGVALDDVAELLLAGGFGNYLSLASAERIGLIPHLPAGPRGRRAHGWVRYVGNAALLGAELCLLSEAERRRAGELARAARHVPLAAHPEFERIFVECLDFPPAVSSASSRAV